MAENLKVTHYRNGDEIEYYDYDNNPSNSEIYGRLYDWHTVDDERGVCPDGWHIPTDEEYILLTDYLGGETIAGGKMKEEGLEHWNSPNEGATNESGFTGLPGGYRGSIDGAYSNIGGSGYFWSSSDNDSDDAWYRELVYDYAHITRNYFGKQSGFNIRCLAD